MTEEYKYYRSVEGAVVQRYGQQTYIGVRRGGNQHQWSDKIVRLPMTEFTRFQREYTRAVKAGSLIELNSNAYIAQQKKIEAEEKKLAEATAKQKKLDAAAAKKMTAKKED